MNIGPVIVCTPLLMICTAMYQTSSKTLEVAIYGNDTPNTNKTI